jgi:hypothetical protein
MLAAATQAHACHVSEMQVNACASMHCGTYLLVQHSRSKPNRSDGTDTAQLSIDRRAKWQCHTDQAVGIGHLFQRLLQPTHQSMQPNGTRAMLLDTHTKLGANCNTNDAKSLSNATHAVTQGLHITNRSTSCNKIHCMVDQRVCWGVCETYKSINAGTSAAER